MVWSQTQGRRLLPAWFKEGESIRSVVATALASRAYRAIIVGAIILECRALPVWSTVLTSYKVLSLVRRLGMQGRWVSPDSV